MSRSTISLIALAILVLAGAFVLFRSREEARDPAPPRSLGDLTRREPLPTTPGVPLPATRPSEEVPARPEGPASDDPAAGDGATGRLRGLVRREGQPAAGFQIILTPPAGEILLAPDGAFEVRGIPPGEYLATVVAERSVGRTRGGIRIEAARTSRIEFDLEAGVRPAGRVEDSMTQKPIANVLIDFNGEAKAKTDAAGRFVSPWFVSAAALKVITLSHPEYDIATYTQMAIPDPNDFMLALGRGDGTIEGEIRGALGLDPKADVLIRLHTDMGGSRFELRRELRQLAGLTYRFQHVRAGIHEVSVEFPGTEFASRRKRVHIYSSAPSVLDFDLQAGTTLEARLSARAIGVRSLGIELVTPEGQPVASGVTDSDGVWRLSGVEPGTYHFRVTSGALRFNTEGVVVTEGEPIRLIEIDCDKRRLKVERK